MDIKELQQYLPNHPTAPLVYGWIRSGPIPYYKKGKKLAFKQSEIEEWMTAACQQTDVVMESTIVAPKSVSEEG